VDDNLAKLGIGAQIVIAVYILFLLVIGWFSHRASRDNSMKDFYLAGRGLGLFVLILTLYATQYSGNTLVGFTAKSYRNGFSWIMSLHFMTAIIVFYLLYAPRLYPLARARGYITPSDYLNDRFNSPAVALIASIVMILALSNYLLGQLLAMGHVVVGILGGGRNVFIGGVIALALILVIYETLGGMRAVAWTDAMQGTILATGFIILLVLVFREFGPIADTTRAILEQPDTQMKAAVPKAPVLREWLSYILVVGIGGALYPQAIQRIYAARSATILRRSLVVMAFLPLVTTVIAVIVGVMAIVQFPGLKETTQSEQVLLMVFNHIQSSSTLGYWLIIFLIAAVLAAIMSTADSALLAISSMLTQDIYRRYVNPDAGQETLTRLGRTCSWCLIGFLVFMACALYEKMTLVRLLDRKFDMLVQLAPAFMIGIRWRKLQALPVTLGIIAGLATALLMARFGFGKFHNIHAGLYGLALNLLIAIAGSILISRKAAKQVSGSSASPSQSLS
jgi:SSS family solute:Na+ symporter